MALILKTVLLFIFYSTALSMSIVNQKVNQPSTENLSTRAVIFPGTKWCGVGNISRSYDDLGIFRKADACCRDHDHCPDYIEAGQKKYGLTNNGWFSKMHCDCDKKFMECLKNNTNTDSVSFKISVMYFNLFQNQCFKKDFPNKCTHYYFWVFPLRCQNYGKNTSVPEEYQYIDNPVIIGI